MKKLLIGSMVAALFMADAHAGVFSKLKDSISSFANKIGISNKTTVMDKGHKKQLTNAAQVFSKKVETICKGNSLSKEQKKTYGKDLDNLKSKMKTLVNFIKSAAKASVVSQASIQSVNQITGEITSLTEFWAKKPEVSKLSEDFYYAIADLWTTVANFARKGVYSNHEVLQKSDEAISKIKSSTWLALYPGTNEPTAYIDAKYRSQVTSTVYRTPQAVAQSPALVITDKEQRKELDEATKVFSKKVDAICKGNSLSKEQKKAYKKDLNSLKSEIKTLMNFVKTAEKTAVVSQTSVQSINQITNEIMKVTDFWAKKPGVSKLSKDFYYAVADLWLVVANLARKGVYSGNEVLQRSDEAISKIKNSTWQALHPGTTEPKAYIDDKYKTQVASTANAASQTIGQIETTKINKVHKKEINFAAKVFSKKIEYLCKGESLPKEQKKAYSKDLDNLKNNMKTLVDFVKSAEKFIIASQTSVQSVDQITAETITLTGFWAKKPEVSKLSEDFYYAIVDLWMTVANLARKGIYSGHEVLQKSDEVISKMKSSAWQALYPGMTEPTAYIDAKYKNQGSSTAYKTNTASTSQAVISVKPSAPSVTAVTQTASSSTQTVSTSTNTARTSTISSGAASTSSSVARTSTTSTATSTSSLFGSSSSISSTSTASTSTSAAQTPIVQREKGHMLWDEWVASTSKDSVIFDDEEELIYAEELKYLIGKKVSFPKLKKLQIKGEYRNDGLYINTSNDLIKGLAILLDNAPNLEDLSINYGLSGVLTSEICKLKKLTSLNLKDNSLTGLPSEIGQLTNLKTLVLQNNQITTLPNEIGNLKNLTSLDLYNNTLTTLPAGIGNLKNLTSLNIGSSSYRSNLRSLPDEIGNLTNLTSLNLCYNRNLTSLPNTIGNLKNLTSLNLYSCRLTTLPAGIGDLTKLTNLDLSNQQLRSLPNEIGNMTNLTSLNLRYNYNLTALPEGIGNLKNLTSLDLSNCRLTNLPEGIGGLTNLKTLKVGSDYFGSNTYDNQLTTLPNTIGNLKNLISLSLNSNKLTSLPNTIGNLTNLTSLDLNNNKITILPQEIRNLVNLTSLNVSNNQLTSLPVGIENLTKLPSLNISHNQIAELPEGIGRLTNITTLDVSYNKLTGLPNTIGNLTNLTSLYVDHNQISSIPNTIGNLKKLNYLNVTGNQLTSLPNEIGNLTNLQTLYMYDNRLSSVPSTIGNLTRLYRITIDERGKKHLPQNLQSKVQSVTGSMPPR